jgi:peptide/nickel transport system substrate-binding protein
MKKWSFLVTVVMTLALLLACGPAAPEPSPAPVEPTPEPPTEPAPAPEAPSRAHLTPNPIEESKPIYGGIIGDLAESWKWSEDGKAITFKLRQGVKWHDGMPFTSDDVIYSLEKMTDVNCSAISDWFPAFENIEKIDQYTVKVNLKYPSAGFLLALAQGESVIQSLHLAGTDHQSADFMIGTGPFILDDYLTQVHLKYRRNPDYWKKDRYGNQLPYLDGLAYYALSGDSSHEMLIGRRLDFRGPVSGAGKLSAYELLKEGAPELLFQKRDRSFSMATIYLNLNKKPLDDIRVRRAFGLVLVQEDEIIGYGGDIMFGVTDSGLLHPDCGLPKEEVAKLMGWDKPYDERVAEAQQLMAEAGYPDGFKLNIMSAGVGSVGQAGASLIFAEALRVHLKIDAEVHVGLGGPELWKRVEENNYDMFTYSLQTGLDPVQLATYFGTDGYSNWSNYSNPEMDKMLAELDYIIDLDKRREVVWAIERILLTDLAALPTGCFASSLMPYYPHVKNLRWTNMSYSNICRLEDVWIDESLRVK